MWQDTVLAITQIAFALALIPSIVHPNEKPALVTSLMNVFFIVIVVIVYATLDLLVSTLGAATIGLEWGVLAYQRYMLDKENTVA